MPDLGDIWDATGYLYNPAPPPFFPPQLRKSKSLGRFESRPLCVRCEVIMECHQNDVIVVRYQRGVPTAMSHADEFRCPTCRSRVVEGYGDKVEVDHVEIDWAERNGMLRKVIAIA